MWGDLLTSPARVSLKHPRMQEGGHQCIYTLTSTESGNLPVVHGAPDIPPEAPDETPTHPPTYPSSLNIYESTPPRLLFLLSQLWRKSWEQLLQSVSIIQHWSRRDEEQQVRWTETSEERRCRKEEKVCRNNEAVREHACWSGCRFFFLFLKHPRWRDGDWAVQLCESGSQQSCSRAGWARVVLIRGSPPFSTGLLMPRCLWELISKLSLCLCENNRQKESEECRQKRLKDCGGWFPSKPAPLISTYSGLMCWEKWGAGSFKS